MLAACFLATSLLCISDDYRLAAQRASIFEIPSDVIPKQADPAAAQRLGVEITIVASDDIGATPVKGLYTVCADGNCTYYWKHCDEVQKVCAYSYAPLSPAEAPAKRPTLIMENISIHYQSDNALRAAENNIYLVVGDANKPTYVSLSQLKPSSLPRLPVCEFQSSEPVCYGPPTQP